MSPIIYENARKGSAHQYHLYVDEFLNGNFEMAMEHYKAYELLRDMYQDFIPCLDDEL